MPLSIGYFSAGGGHRTHTPLAGPRILSPVRLPVPPPRHVDDESIVSTSYAVSILASAFASLRLSPRIVPIACTPRRSRITAVLPRPPTSTRLTIPPT